VLLQSASAAAPITASLVRNRIFRNERHGIVASGASCRLDMTGNEAHLCSLSLSASLFLCLSLGVVCLV
jgi:hypothetical protein